MAYQAGGSRPQPRPAPESREAQAYLQDYAALLETVTFPSVVVDHRWDVVLANGAFETLFRGVGPHPTAMPGDNFLRFVLFHPDAGTVLGEHESSWCLPMLAHFAAAVERHGHDHGLQSILRDIAQDPIMDAAYRHGLPHWIRSVGPDAVEHDGAVRPLMHPDPRWGRTDCRIVGETTKTLQGMGYTRLTLVLREARRAPARRTRRASSHLSVVPTAEV
ncbi:MmyB family transcriptional regulator [Streptomyces phaeochromogenes]|uniref:MmyB family transcriptional regulator n=1 Tax=Streptomyces phaeochromogenes TaxID=1923 RepID=UPI0033EBC965